MDGQDRRASEPMTPEAVAKVMRNRGPPEQRPEQYSGYLMYQDLYLSSCPRLAECRMSILCLSVSTIEELHTALSPSPSLFVAQLPASCLFQPHSLHARHPPRRTSILPFLLREHQLIDRASLLSLSTQCHPVCHWEAELQSLLVQRAIATGVPV